MGSGSERVKAYLATVRHEVETSHEKDHVAEEEPVLAEGDFAFGQECACDVTLGSSESLPVTVGLCFWQAQTENDDQDWRACSEPEQWTPAVGSGVDEAAGKRCG